MVAHGPTRKPPGPGQNPAYRPAKGKPPPRRGLSYSVGTGDDAQPVTEASLAGGLRRRTRMRVSAERLWSLADRTRRLALWRLDLPLEDLAGRSLRKVVDEPDDTRVLIGGYLALDVVAQLFRGCLRAIL